MKLSELKKTYTYRVEESIYEKAEKLIKVKTGLGVGTFLRMQLIRYLNDNKDENKK
jgi:hypothetical protein